MKRTPGWQAKALATYDEQEKVTLSGTLAELGRHGAVLSTVNQLKHRRVLWSRRSINGVEDREVCTTLHWL